MYIDSSYSGKDYPMPNFEGTPTEKKKTKEWHLSVVKWIYCLDVNDKTAITKTNIDKYRLMRLYGAGNQPSDYYENRLKGNSSQSTASNASTLNAGKEGKKKGWDNIDFESIISVMPLIKSILLPTIKNIDYDISCDAVDPLSGSEEENKMYAKWARVENGPALDALAQQYNIPLEADEYTPDDFQDLKQIRAEGGFKPDHSIEVEELIKFTENISRWDEELYRDIIDEALNNGWACAYECYDAEIKMSKWERVLPEDVIKQASKSKRYDDSDFEGVYTDYSISTMRTYFPETTDSEWRSIATRFKSYTGVENTSGLNVTDPTREYATEDIDQLRIPVAYVRWNDVEQEDYVEFENKQGEKRILDYKDGGAYSSKQNKKTFRNRVSSTCKWVIGTEDMIFEYGPYPNNPKKNTRPQSFVKICKFPYEPITWRLRPLLDQLQIAWLKYQNALSVSIPGGIAIDMSMIANISDKHNWNELDVLDMFFNRGVYPFKQNPLGIRQGGGQTSPVIPIPSNVLSALTDYITIIDQMLVLVEKLTGLSPIALGAAPVKDQAVGTSELSYSSTMKALIDVVDMCKVVKEDLGGYSAERLRIMFEADPEVRNVYESVIGKDGVQIIRNATKRNVQYGYNLVARPTEAEKNAVLEQAQISLGNNQAGKPGINEGQRTKVIFMVSSGVNLKMIGRYMDTWIRKDEKLKTKAAKENQQAQSESLLQLEDKKNQNFMQQDEVKTKSQIEIDKMNSENKINEIIVKAEADRKADIKNRNTDYKNSLKEEANAAKLG